MAQTKSTSKQSNRGDPRARPHQSLEAYKTSLKWHESLPEKLAASRVKCICGKEIGSTPSARKKHVDTHLPLDLRKYPCSFSGCRKRFAQATQRQCHQNTCKKRPPGMPCGKWYCGILLLTKDGKLFACGYKNPHARDLTHHRQHAHGQLNREQSHNDALEGRQVLSPPQREHPDTYFVPMPKDCSSFDLSPVPECYRAAVGAAAQREVDIATARLEEEFGAKGRKTRAHTKKAVPPSAPIRGKGKGKGNTKPTAAIANARRKTRAATALLRSFESPTLSDLTSLPSLGSPSPSSPTTATSSTSMFSRRRRTCQTASTGATSPVISPQELSFRDECPTVSAPPEPHVDEPYVHTPYVSSSPFYAAPPYSGNHHIETSYTAPPPALPRFHEAFGNIPLPHGTVWSHLPPEPATYASLDTHSAELHSDALVWHTYRDRPRPHASAPIHCSSARYEPYAPPMRAPAYRRDRYEEFTQGSSKDGRISAREREAYRYTPLEQPVHHSAAHASSAARERRARDDGGRDVSCRDEDSGSAFRLRQAQW